MLLQYLGMTRVPSNPAGVGGSVSQLTVVQREWAAWQWPLLSATQHQKHLRAQTLTETHRMSK